MSASDRRDISAATAAKIEAFVKDLKRRSVRDGAAETARRTAVILRQVVADSRCLTAAELVDSVRATGERLAAANHTGASGARV